LVNISKLLFNEEVKLMIYIPEKEEELLSKPPAAF
jgi:hypothetical protein